MCLCVCMFLEGARYHRLWKSILGIRLDHVLGFERQGGFVFRNVIWREAIS